MFRLIAPFFSLIALCYRLVAPFILPLKGDVEQSALSHPNPRPNGEGDLW